MLSAKSVPIKFKTKIKGNLRKRRWRTMIRNIQFYSSFNPTYVFSFPLKELWILSIVSFSFHSVNFNARPLTRIYRENIFFPPEIQHLQFFIKNKRRTIRNINNSRIHIDNIIPQFVFKYVVINIHYKINYKIRKS